MNKLFAIAILCAFSCESVSATQYSKLSVITCAKQRGCWASLKAFISNADLKDEWDCCQYLSDNYPQFASLTNAIVTSGAATPEDVAYILTNSVDVAVADAFLRRVYDTDMNSSIGRSKWHGRKLREVVDTNSMTKVSFYEDGSFFADKAKITTPIDSVRKSNAMLPRTSMTNGIPARLAAARIRRQKESEAGVSNVTVSVRAGGN